MQRARHLASFHHSSQIVVPLGVYGQSARRRGATRQALGLGMESMFTLRDRVADRSVMFAHAWILKALAATACLLLLDGCVFHGTTITWRPPVSVPNDLGIVRATHVEAAKRVAATSKTLHEHLLGSFPGFGRRRRLEIWLVEDARDSGHGVSLSGFFKDVIVLRGSHDDARTDSLLAHELAHIMMESEWYSLPPFVIEGICEHVAVASTGDLSLELARYQTAAQWLGMPAGFVFGPWTSCPQSPEASHSLCQALRQSRPVQKADYGVAFASARLLLDRVGFDGLHRLVENATQQTEGSISGLLSSVQEDAVREYLTRTVTRDYLRNVITRAPNIVLENSLFVGALRQYPSPQQALSDLDPRLVAPSGEEVHLKEIPEFCVALYEEWSKVRQISR